MLASEPLLPPLLLMNFIGSTAEAAKSCFQGKFVAFDQSETHRVNGRGSKNSASRVCLLPLLLVSFIGSAAEAAKFCFSGLLAAFDSWWLQVWKNQVVMTGFSPYKKAATTTLQQLHTAF